MEISRQFKPVLAIPAEAPAASRKANTPAPESPATRSTAGESLPLEQMHDALRSMPELDLDRVAAIRQALQRGEITTDPAALAGSMLAYHRGTDA